MTVANTPQRALRVPDEEWEPALARAQDEGTTLTAVLRAFLREYGAQRPPRGSRGRQRR